MKEKQHFSKPENLVVASSWNKAKLYRVWQTEFAVSVYSLDAIRKCYVLINEFRISTLVIESDICVVVNKFRFHHLQ